MTHFNRTSLLGFLMLLVALLLGLIPFAVSAEGVSDLQAYADDDFDDDDDEYDEDDETDFTDLDDFDDEDEDEYDDEDDDDYDDEYDDYDYD